MRENKSQRMLLLARKRQATRWEGYSCLGDYQAGAYECDHVSPYSKSAGNLDSPIMVLLQDWSSDKRLSGKLIQSICLQGCEPQLATNRNIRDLLRRHLGVELEETYATNLFPFIKPGNLSENIPKKDYLRAATEFAWPQVEIVEPKLLVCLGLSTFNAMRQTAELPPIARLDDAIRAPFPYLGALVWCQAHSGGMGRAGRIGAGRKLGRDLIEEDWSGMALHYRALA